MKVLEIIYGILTDSPLRPHRCARDTNSLPRNSRSLTRVNMVEHRGSDLSMCRHPEIDRLVLFFNILIVVIGIGVHGMTLLLQGIGAHQGDLLLLLGGVVWVVGLVDGRFADARHDRQINRSLVRVLVMLVLLLVLMTVVVQCYARQLRSYCSCRGIIVVVGGGGDERLEGSTPPRPTSNSTNHIPRRFTGNPPPARQTLHNRSNHHQNQEPSDRPTNDRSTMLLEIRLVHSSKLITPGRSGEIIDTDERIRGSPGRGCQELKSRDGEQVVVGEDKGVLGTSLGRARRHGPGPGLGIEDPHVHCVRICWDCLGGVASMHINLGSN